MQGPEPGSLPEDGGIYVLVLRHAGRLFRSRIGALGARRFEAGFYCYVGSARRGLRARLARHLRRTRKRAHWHVDHLRRRAEPVAVVVWIGERGDECGLSDAAARLADDSVPGFGASDCRCLSHLHYFAADPAQRLLAIRPAGAHTMQLVWSGETGT